MSKISDFFFIQKGKGSYYESYDIGETPLISATNTNNGVIGFVNAKPTFNAPLITVERVTGKGFVQLLDFITVPDDISVLVPKQKMSLDLLFFAVATINKQSWKFSYSRKLTPTRLGNLEIDLSKFTKQAIIINARLPKRRQSTELKEKIKLKDFSLVELIEKVELGAFHVRTKLKKGGVPFISCKTDDNGIADYVQVTDETTWNNSITIASDGTPLTTYYHPYRFTAQDNVLVCKPKPFKLSTIYFIVLQLNRLRWKFSYGRKCYLNKVDKIKIKLPIDEESKINEKVIEKIAKNTYGWYEVEKFCELGTT